MTFLTDEQSEARERVEEALYHYAESLGYDAAHYPFIKFTELMDEMEGQEVIE